MHYYMGTHYTPKKYRSSESSRPYTENGVKKSGNFGLVGVYCGLSKKAGNLLN
jgi:hypothetical protein